MNTRVRLRLREWLSGCKARWVVMCWWMQREDGHTTTAHRAEDAGLQAVPSNKQDPESVLHSKAYKDPD